MDTSNSDSTHEAAIPSFPSFKQRNAIFVNTSFPSHTNDGITVLKIEATRTYHGRHYYFYLAEPVDASTANRLQYLLGDDSKRVDYNQARINSRLTDWNKLFETVGRRTVTLYRHPSCSRNIPGTGREVTRYHA
jgi:hypothetical protein